MSDLANFCPQCGTPLIEKPHYGVPRRTCPGCGYLHFRDPKVAAVLFIVEDGNVLLGRRSVDPQSGRWTLPAGYIDYGEDPREAALRELKEETNLDAEITRLIDVLGPDHSGESKPAILIVFEARVIGGAIRPADDLSEARFFAPDEIPFDGLAFRATRTLIERWISGT